MIKEKPVHHVIWQNWLRESFDEEGRGIGDLHGRAVCSSSGQRDLVMPKFCLGVDFVPEEHEVTCKKCVGILMKKQKADKSLKGKP